MRPKLITTLVFAALVGLPLSAAAADKSGGPGISGGSPGKAADMPRERGSSPGMGAEAPKGPGATGAEPETKADRGTPKGTGAMNFNRLDRNNDGFISADEAKGGDMNAARFKELDKDGDGRISREEAGGQLPGTPGGVSDTKR
jgi:EF hand domain-containing protein